METYLGGVVILILVVIAVRHCYRIVKRIRDEERLRVLRRNCIDMITTSCVMGSLNRLDRILTIYIDNCPESRKPIPALMSAVRQGASKFDYELIVQVDRYHVCDLIAVREILACPKVSPGYITYLCSVLTTTLTAYDYHDIYLSK